MEWNKWTEENLPNPGQIVLIRYKSGVERVTKFFHDKKAKDNYIKGMKWSKKNPDSNLRTIGNMLRNLGNMIRNLVSDPIITWIEWPHFLLVELKELPKNSGECK